MSGRVRQVRDEEDTPLRALCWRVRIATVSGFLEEVARLRTAVGVPLQAVRADRVLSRDHLRMAATHAKRAIAAGRARAHDPAVEFLLYAAIERQIHRAVTALGVTQGEQEVVFVAFGAPSDARFEAAVEAAPSTIALRPWEDHDASSGTRKMAHDWWAGRLGATSDDPRSLVEERLYAQMALLALDRA